MTIAFNGAFSGITKAMFNLANVDNASDILQPVSSATQAILDLKGALANPTFIGAVCGISEAMVNLGNVDNTTDSAKQVLISMQTALNLTAKSTDATSSLAAKTDQLTTYTEPTSMASSRRCSMELPMLSTRSMSWPPL